MNSNRSPGHLLLVMGFSLALTPVSRAQTPSGEQILGIQWADAPNPGKPPDGPLGVRLLDLLMDKRAAADHPNASPRLGSEIDELWKECEVEYEREIQAGHNSAEEGDLRAAIQHYALAARLAGKDGFDDPVKAEAAGRAEDGILSQFHNPGPLSAPRDG